MNWALKETAQWWAEQDQKYEQYGHNKESMEYLSKLEDFDSVLEVGSGTGRLINNLDVKRRGAIDINPHLLKLVEVKKYNIDISKKTISDKYEVVYTYQCLQHLTHDQFKNAIENIKKIATKEIWLIEGYVPNVSDGDRTHKTGSYYHAIHEYLNCYKIDDLDNGKIKVYRSKDVENA